MVFLVDDILMAPANAVIWLADKVKDEVNKKMFDVDSLKKVLEELQERHDQGEIEEPEFLKAEAQILQALSEAKRYQKEKGEQP